MNIDKYFDRIFKNTVATTAVMIMANKSPYVLDPITCVLPCSPRRRSSARA